MILIVSLVMRLPRYTADPSTGDVGRASPVDGITILLAVVVWIMGSLDSITKEKTFGL